MYLLVTTYDSSNTTLEEGGTARRVLICSSRVVSRCIKQAFASVNSCDITVKALCLSNSQNWYSCPLRLNPYSLWSHSCWNDMRGSGASFGSHQFPSQRAVSSSLHQQIILQPCFLFINIPGFIPIFSNSSFHVDTVGPFLEDGLEKGILIHPLNSMTKELVSPWTGVVCLYQLPHHPSWIV